MQIDLPAIRNRTIRGFTLLEILVAIFILAIVMGLIFGTFEGVFSDAAHVNAGSDTYAMADSCLKRITTDLTALHVTQDLRYKIPITDSKPDKPDLYRIEGSIDSFGGSTFSRLRFTSSAHLPIDGENRAGIAEIVYYVQETADNTYVLRRADKLYPYPESFEPKKSDPILCENVRAFKLTYYDKKGREHDQWDSDSGDYEYSTPESIAVHLTIGSKSNSYDFSTEITLPMHRFISQKR